MEHVIYLFVTLYGVCLFIDICERTTNQFDPKILSQDKYCSKKVLFGWSEGTALIDSFGPFIYTLYNDNNFSREGYTKQLSKGRGAPVLHCTPILGGPDSLHPSLDTGLGKTYIIILILYNLHMPRRDRTFKKKIHF